MTEPTEGDGMRSDSQWYGDSTNGIEFRQLDSADELDEVLLYVDGKCVVHLEAMSETSYWIGLYAKGHEAHLHIGSKSGRARVDCRGDAMPITAASAAKRGDK